MMTLLAYQNCGKPVKFSGQENVKDVGNPDPENPTNPDVPPPNDEDPDDDIIPTCQNSTLYTEVINVSFAPTQDCKWSQDGNLGKKDTYIQARLEEVKDLSIPAGATLCDMEFAFQEQTFEYDDHVILTLNDKILMTTGADMLSLLDADGAGYTYNWEKLKGKRHDVGNTRIYCNGSGSSCSLPQTDIAGKINLDFPKAVIQKIITIAPKSTNQIKLITTGDNDAGDCRHEAVSFQVKAIYHK